MDQDVGTLYITRCLNRKVDDVTQWWAVTCCASSELVFEESGITLKAFASTAPEHCMMSTVHLICFLVTRESLFCIPHDYRVSEMFDLEHVVLLLVAPAYVAGAKCYKCPRHMAIICIYVSFCPMIRIWKRKSLDSKCFKDRQAETSSSTCPLPVSHWQCHNTHISSIRWWWNYRDVRTMPADLQFKYVDDVKIFPNGAKSQEIELRIQFWEYFSQILTQQWF